MLLGNVASHVKLNDRHGTLKLPAVHNHSRAVQTEVSGAADGDCSNYELCAQKHRRSEHVTDMNTAVEWCFVLRSALFTALP